MSKKEIDYIFKYIIAVVGGFLLLSNLGKALSAAAVVLSAASPLFIGVFIAYLVDAPAALIRRRLFSLKIFSSLGEKRQNGISILLAYLIFFALIAFLLFVFIPGVLRSFYSFLQTLPDMLQGVLDFLSRAVFDGEEPQFLASALVSAAESLSSGAQVILTSVGSGAAAALGNIWQSLSSVFFGLVFSVYILMNRARIKELGAKVLLLLFNEPLRTAVTRLLGKFHATFRRYIFGQMTDAAILGVLCFLGMLVLGLPYAAGISLVVAAMSLIPIAGTFIGVGVSALVLLAGDPWDSLIFLIFVLILQQVENNLIYPKIVGNALGIDGMFVFAGVVVGAGLWGVKGMVLGVPATAFLYSLFSDFFAIRTRKRKDLRID